MYFRLRYKSEINVVIESSDNENTDAIIATKTITGIIVSTKEKANCPGKIDITGFLIIVNICFIRSFNLLIITFPYFL